MNVEVRKIDDTWNVPAQAWNKFCEEAFNPTSEVSNFKYEFKVLTKKYGQSYIQFCKASWMSNETMTPEEFCKMNGDMPIGFFKGKIQR